MQWSDYTVSSNETNESLCCLQGDTVIIVTLIFVIESTDKPAGSEDKSHQVNIQFACTLQESYVPTSPLNLEM